MELAAFEAKARFACARHISSSFHTGPCFSILGINTGIRSCLPVARALKFSAVLGTSSPALAYY